MKKILCLIALALALVLALAACGEVEPTITVSDDGYVVVNGVKTEYLVDKSDVVTVDAEGYVVVNGAKTEYQIHQATEGCAHSFDANGICTVCNAADPNRIQYAVNVGTKIEALPSSEQEMIDAYVADCKTLYTASYAFSSSDWDFLTPYVSFTNVVVYDFRQVDENSMDSRSLMIWNKLKTYHEGTSPILYVELAGYNASFSNDLLTPIESGGILNGFFIYEDGTFEYMTYMRVCSTIYCYQIVEGTEIINCGNKYAESFNAEQLRALISSIEGGQSHQSMLKKLIIEE